MDKTLQERVDELVTENDGDVAAVAYMLGRADENVKWRAANAELYQALAFAKSVILSGERWDETCEQMIDGALRKARGE